MRKIISIKDGVTRHPDYRMAEPVNLDICEGEQIAIVGENASGKSRLVDIITSRYPLLLNEVHYDFGKDAKPLVSENIKYITFRDSYGESDGSYYYQQRWNQHDIDESTPTVRDILAKTCELQHSSTELKQQLFEMFHLEPLLDKYIITLSSGELRKFQLTKKLLSGPRVLIMDNPFIGLDVQTRELLSELLNRLTRETNLLVIIILSKTDALPTFITHVIPVKDCIALSKQTAETFINAQAKQTYPGISKEVKDAILNIPIKDISKEAFYPQKGGEILQFNHVTIRYGERTILKELDWTVHEGERWALRGENGCGKSTLLSLVCADNPQSYACDIRLFGHQRGTGESIWEIKRHIGYVSPEMHRAYLKDLPAIDIVASGLSDSVGLYVRPRPEQRDICLLWMRIFGIEHLADRTFLRLSSGEQRLCLLARAFVKDPELLILDEPLHGLDLPNRYLVKQIIETFCQRPNKTLVMVTHYEEELPRCITNTLTLRKNI